MDRTEIAGMLEDVRKDQAGLGPATSEIVLAAYLELTDKFERMQTCR